MKPGNPKYEKILSPYLAEWQADIKSYVPELVRVTCVREEHRPVIFFDNVDQLKPAYQADIFLLAQRVARIVGSITLVALREESYYTANVRKAFTAFTSKKFHIESPHFRKMISARIKYASNLLLTSQTETSGGDDQNTRSITDFFAIVEKSVFGKNKNIVRFIEAICFGNMRLALSMFTNFLVSGSTDVDKMLDIYRKEKFYNVAFHEFAKSIMLGEKRYYKEEEDNPIFNMFNVGTEKNSSQNATKLSRNLFVG